jgi:sugar/nucleoside kinase (ribokinase family)
MNKDTFDSDITILGHLAKDIIEVDGISRESIGGAVYYGGIAGSHMGLKISIITLLKKEDYPILEIFKKKGITYFAYPSKETSGLRNIYSSKNIEFRDYKLLGFAGLFKKENIPDINPKIFVIGPIMEGEINIELLNILYKRYRGKLALDIQGFIRVRENSNVFYKDLLEEEKEIILSKVDYLKVDQKEANILTKRKNINDALIELRTYGPQEILATHQKGITVNALDEIYFFPWKNKTIMGRTGRGDTAFISYLGSRISKNPEESLKFSTALTSLKMESPGPFGLTLFEIENFILEHF